MTRKHRRHPEHRTWPPTEDWFHDAHYVQGDEFYRLRNGTWETWDHQKRAWFRAPSLAVKAIERDMNQ